LLLPTLLWVWRMLAGRSSKTPEPVSAPSRREAFKRKPTRRKETSQGAEITHGRPPKPPKRK
jgi:hypothetical protein